MKKAIKSSIIMLNIFGALSATVQAQEQTDYYYQGYTFNQANGVKSASPYLTVVLLEEDNDMPKAVSMSNAIGDVSFRGIPMDISRQNKLKVYAGNSLIGVYLPKRWTKRPPFPAGNMNAHMEVPPDMDFYTIREPALPVGDNVSLRDFLCRIPDIELDEGNVFVNGFDGSLRVFVNNVNLTEEKFNLLLDNLTTDYIKSCQFILYNEPNKYFAGAVNIILIAGDPGHFPDDTQYINSLPMRR